MQRLDYGAEHYEGGLLVVMRKLVQAAEWCWREPGGVAEGEVELESVEGAEEAAEMHQATGCTVASARVLQRTGSHIPS